MNKLAIISDTAADLPRLLVDERHITIVPLYVTINDETFRDEEGINSTDLYNMMRYDRAIPKTSQPSPEDFRVAFTTALEGAHEVLCLTVSTSVSGTNQSAQLARDLLPDPSRVTIMDTQLASIGEGLLVLMASDLAGEGLTAKEIVTKLEKTRIKGLFTVEHLKYLERGGRISKAQASIATVLDIKPVLTISAATDGKIATETKARGRGKAIKYLMDEVISQVSPGYTGYLGISHALCPEEAEKIQSSLSKVFPHAKFVISDIGCTIGAHAGPGTVAVFFPAEK